MATRASIDDVKDIFEVKNLKDNDISAFIATANLLVTEVLGSSSLSSDRLKHIEQWLAAHLCATKDQRQSARTVDGRTTLAFQGKTDMGLEATHYGQTVLMLDSTGSLAEAAAGLKKAEIVMIDRVES